MRKMNWKIGLVACAVWTAGPGGNFASAAADAQEAPIDLAGWNAHDAEAMREAVRLGWITGWPNLSYRPDQVLTRQEFAKLLAKSLELPVFGVQDSGFRDVPPSGWAAPYIEAARASGLMTGSGSDFRPQAPVSREEAACVLVRALGGPDSRGGRAIDAGSAGPVSPWAGPSVEAALRLGLFNSSVDGGDFKTGVTRGEILPLLVDLFAAKEKTAAVTSVDGDTLLFGDGPRLVAESLKPFLLDSGNAEALEGALITFRSGRPGIREILKLDIVASGTSTQPVKLNVSRLPSSATLALSGDHIAVSGSSIPIVSVRRSALHIELNGQVGRLHIENAGSLDVKGQAAFGEVRISNPAAQVTLGPRIRIDRLVIPVDSQPGFLIANLAQVRPQIRRIVSSAGVNLPLTPPAVAVPAEPPLIFSVPAVTPDPIFPNPSVPAVTPDPTVPSPSVPAVTPDPIPPNPSVPVVPIEPNRLAVEQDSAELALGFADGDAADRVAQSVRLPLAGGRGSVVSWMSDKEETLSANGTVTRAVYGSGDTPVTLTATLAKGSATASRKFELIVKAQDSPILDLSALQARLQEARLLSEQASVGNGVGQVPDQAYRRFMLAVTNANQIAQEAQKNQRRIDQAVTAIRQAIEEFKQAQIPELTISLRPNAEFILNNKYPDVWKKVYLNSTKSLSNQPPYQYTRRDINDLIEVKKGGVPQSIVYDNQTKIFKIYEETVRNGISHREFSGRTLSVQSHFRELVVARETGGISVTQQFLNDTPTAQLQFDLMNGSTKISDVKLGPTVDLTPPIWNQCFYENGRFELVATEKITYAIKSYEGEEGLTVKVRISYSPSNSADDVVGLTGISYYLEEGKQDRFFVKLDDNWVKDHAQLPPTGIFNITIDGVTDYGNHEVATQTVSFENGKIVGLTPRNPHLM